MCVHTHAHIFNSLREAKASARSCSERIVINHFQLQLKLISGAAVLTRNCTVTGVRSRKDHHRLHHGIPPGLSRVLFTAGSLYIVFILCFCPPSGQFAQFLQNRSSYRILPNHMPSVRTTLVVLSLVPRGQTAVVFWVLPPCIPTALWVLSLMTRVLTDVVFDPCATWPVSQCFWALPPCVPTTLWVLSLKTHVLTAVLFDPCATWPDSHSVLSLTTMYPDSLMGFEPYDACSDRRSVWSLCYVASQSVFLSLTTMCPDSLMGFKP